MKNSPSLKSLHNSTFFKKIYNDDFFMPIHQHRTYELMYVKKGTLQLLVEQNENNKFSKTSILTLVSHQYVLIDINVPHQLIIPKGQSCHLLNVEFSLTYNIPPVTYPSICDIVLSTDELKDCESIKCFFSEQFDAIVLDDIYGIENIINNLHSILNAPYSFENEYMRNLLLCQLMLSISKCKFNNTSNLADSNLYIRKAISYIEQNYQNDISIIDIAEFVNLNKDYLQRLFKEKTSSTIYSILQEYRIQKSKKLLIESTYSIHDISVMVGFKNRQNFTKNFSKFCNISPQEYRKNKENEEFLHYDIYIHLYNKHYI